MAYVKSFRDLEVYKSTRKLAQENFEISRIFPKEEKYSMTDQVRRSSRSVGAQIAESCAKRKYPKHFMGKLTDTDGEQLKTQHWVETSRDCDYTSKEKATYFLTEYGSVGKMLNALMEKSDMFCQKPAIKKIT